MARSNSNSLIDRSSKFFSRSSAARVWPPTISGSRVSPVTRGRNAFSAASPTSAAAKIARQTKIRFSALVPRMMNTAAVAHTSAPSVKNCHGRKESDVGCVGGKGLIEVFELAIEPRVQRRVLGRNRRRRRRQLVVRSARPLPHHEGAGHGSESTDRIRKKPREPIEPLVDRRRERFLAAVLGDVILNDLLARLALFHKARQLGAHVSGFAARALCQVFAATRAAHADDVALQLALERGIYLGHSGTGLNVLCECRRRERQHQ